MCKCIAAELSVIHVESHSEQNVVAMLHRCVPHSTVTRRQRVTRCFSQWCVRARKRRRKRWCRIVEGYSPMLPIQAVWGVFQLDVYRYSERQWQTMNRTIHFYSHKWHAMRTEMQHWSTIIFAWIIFCVFRTTCTKRISWLTHVHSLWTLRLVYHHSRGRVATRCVPGCSAVALTKTRRVRFAWHMYIHSLA